MTEFVQKKCPTCGGRLELIGGKQYECRCCHNIYERGRKECLYDALQTASVFRESLNFAQAEIAYRNLISGFKEDDLSDVYWNLFLCEQRVIFETDQSGERFPSFYDIVPEEIDCSASYNGALTYAREYDPQKSKTFMKLAAKMRTVKNQYRTIKNTTPPYDIFICFKKTAVDGVSATPDFKLAYELYNKLSREYNVFFSERSLENIVVREFEPNIYHALYTSKVMLLLCSKREYLDSQWVKNEWVRFKTMTAAASQTSALIPIFIDGFSPEDLPYELKSCQGYAADIGLIASLEKAVSAIVRPVDKEAEMAAAINAKVNERMDEMRREFAAEDSRSAPQHGSSWLDKLDSGISKGINSINKGISGIKNVADNFLNTVSDVKNNVQAAFSDTQNERKSEANIPAKKAKKKSKSGIFIALAVILLCVAIAIGISVAIARSRKTSTSHYIESGFATVASHCSSDTVSAENGKILSIILKSN